MTRLQANLLLLLAALFWGGGNVAQKTVLDDLGPLTTVGLRCLIGALVLTLFVLRDRRKSGALHRSDWPQLALAVGLFSLAIGSQQLAYVGTSVTNASFLIATTIVITPLIAWLACRERPSAILWLAVGLTLTGIFLLGGGISMLRWGDLVCLVSAAFYSAWIVALGRLVARTRRPGLVTLVHFVFAGAFYCVAGIASEPIEFAAFERALPELLVLGIFSTGLAYVFQAAAQQHTPAAVAAIIMSTESMFGALGGTLLLGERLGGAGGIGAGLIMLGALLVQTPHGTTAWIARALQALRRVADAGPPPHGHLIRLRSRL